MTTHRWPAKFGFRGWWARDGIAAKCRGGTSRRPHAGHGAAVRIGSLEQLEDRLLLTTLTTLTTSYLDLTIDTTGYVTNVVDHRAPGVSLLSGGAAPFAKVKSGGSWYDTTSATFSNNVLTFSFSGMPSISLPVGVEQGVTNPYFVFTVNTFSPLPDELQLLNFSTTLTTHTSNFSSIATNNSFAMYVRSFTPAGVTTVNAFQANIAYSNHMVGASFALGGSDYGVGGSGVLSSLKTMITNEGLLTSSVGGPWALDAAINQMSYMFASDLSESNVADWISLAQAGGIGIIFTSGWFTSVGHYAISPTRFPHGLAGLKSVADQIHAAGLKLGLHTLSNLTDSNDSYVTPIPDSRLAKDASFTMTSGITSSATTIYVNQTIEGLQTVWGSYGGNVLQVGNELIQYSGYTNNGSQHYFTGLTRGAFGTTAASHSATTLSHVFSGYELFAGDPESTLLDEIGTNLAVTINYVGADMVYLDGIDVGVNTYGRIKGGADIFEKIDHPVRIETSDPSASYLWTFYSNLGAADYPVFGEKRFIDNHVAGNIAGKSNVLMPLQLGWWGVHGSTSNYNAMLPDEMEYLYAKAIGSGESLSLANVTVSPTNGRQADYLAMWKNWQTIAPTLSADMKARLIVPGDEFHLETLPDGSQHLAQVDYAQQKVTGLADGSQTWTVSNTFGAQFPTMRIEGLYGVGSYDNGTQSLTGSQSDVSASTVTSAANVSASLTWSTSQYRPGQSGSMLFSATNNGTSRTGAWTKAARVFSSSLNISGNDAIGVWVYGDNKGEVLNFQVFNTPGYPSVLSDHFVTVNFNGWRYFELPFREPDVDAYYNYTWPYSFGPYEDVRGTVDRGHVGGINIYYNNLQNGTTSNTYISLVKALPVQSIGMVNPSVTIVAGLQIAIANPSFESPVVVGDGNPATIVDDYVGGAATSWERNGAFDGLTVFTRKAGSNFNSRIAPTPDPSDNEQGMTSNGSSFYQVLTSMLQPNTMYTLTADVGRPSDLGFGGGSIELGYGSAFGTNRLTATTDSHPTPGAGSWALWQKTFVTGATVEPNQFLRVEYVGGTVQTMIDNIRLFAAPQIAIANPSFESPVVVGDGNPATIVDDYVVGAATSWTRNGPIDWLTVFTRKPGSYFNSRIAPTPDPSDNDQGMISNGSGFYQVLTSTLQPNTMYTLTADAGRPSDLGFGGGSIQLGYGSAFATNRLTATTDSHPTPGAGNWAVWQKTFVTGATVEPGQFLRIEFVGGTVQTMIDNFRLFAETVSVPAQPVTITFPITLQSGHYIEMNSMNDAKLYDQNGFLIGSVTPTGSLPLLAAGNNTVTFNSTPTSGYNARANVTIASYDVQSATVESVVVNDGNVQRSKVNSVTVTFSEIVTIDPGAFEVRKTGTGGGLVSVAAAFAILNGRTVATLTFSGSLTEYGSLKDGEYQLTVRSDKVRSSVTQAALDGDHLFGAQTADAFFRKFGDSDGDRDVDTVDFARFRLLYLKPLQYKWYLDFDGDGDVDTVDLARFRLRYLT